MFAPINQLLLQMYTALIQGQEPEAAAVEEILRLLRSGQNRIYGAGRAGKMLSRAFRQFQIPLAGFVDRNAAQIDTADDLPVAAPEVLRGYRGEAQELLIIGAGTVQLAELIKKDIRKLDCSINLVNGVFLVYLLQYLICRERCAAGGRPDLSECTAYHVKPYKCPLFCKHVEEMAQREVPFASATGASFNEFGYLLSEVCTLKCEHCLEAVPYLPAKEILPAEVVLRDLRKMVAACRFIHRLDLVGGEPFIHPQLTELLHEIRKIERIGYIGVFTNGTVVPSDALCAELRSERIIVTVADYGASLAPTLRSKIATTLEKLQHLGIQHFHYSDRYWFDINAFEPRQLDEKTLTRNYTNCFLAACRRMYNGVLYHCPYQCNGVKLNKVPDHPEDSIHIHDLSNSELAAALERFEGRKFIEACRYCSIPAGADEVTAGKQL